MATAIPAAIAIERLLQVDTIYAEPAAMALERGRQVLARFPDADLVEVTSHWQIPGLHGNAGSVADWNAIKRTHLVLGTLKSPRLRPTGAQATSSPRRSPTAAR
jgi:spore photoproduct lyase